MSKQVAAAGSEDDNDGTQGGEISPLPEHLQGKRGDGIMGDGALRPGRSNLKMIRRAIKSGWPVPDDLKQKIIQQLRMLVELSDDEEMVVKASKAIMDASSQNIKLLDLELKAVDLLLKREAEAKKNQQPAGGTTVNVNSISISGDTQSLRSRALEILNSLSERAGIEGTDGDPGAISAGSATVGGPVSNADAADAATE